MEFDVLDIVQHVLNIGVLYILLRAILYKPVRRYMLEREEAYVKRRDETEAAKRGAEELRAMNELQLAEAHVKVEKLMEEKLAYAQHVAETTIEEAKAEAARILMEARAEINREQLEARGRIIDETAVLAVDLAARILGREISLEDNERLIDEYFHKVS